MGFYPQHIPDPKDDDFRLYEPEKEHVYDSERLSAMDMTAKYPLSLRTARAVPSATEESEEEEAY